MATVSNYLQASLRLAGILGENDPVDANQGANGLLVLNNVLGLLRGKGIELGIPPQSSTTATLLVPEEDRIELQYILAAFLCMDYGRQPSAHVAMIADSGMSKFLRRAVLNDQLTNDASMPLGAGRPMVNIDTGV